MKDINYEKVKKKFSRKIVKEKKGKEKGKIVVRMKDNLIY